MRTELRLKTDHLKPKNILKIGAIFIFATGCNLSKNDITTGNPAPSKTSTEQAENSPAPSILECIAIAGDSVIFGNVVYEDVSMFQFVTTNIGSLSKYLSEKLPSSMNIEDYSVPEASLAADIVYNDSQIVSSSCQYKSIGPWVNDLGKSNKEDFVNALLALTNKITSQNPDTNILLFNFYVPFPAPFAYNIWPELAGTNRVSEFNSSINQAFANKSTVRILDISSLGRENLATQITDNGTTWNADGTHLNTNGLQTLAGAIVEQIGN